MMVTCPDFDKGVVIPEGGRLKTQATTDDAEFQVCPLTQRAREVLDEIAADRKSRKIAVNADELIFTRDDGRRISRDMISRAVKRAWKKAGVKKFVFHNYRNTALTEWSRRGVHVDIAMKASGHTSTVMHKRYLDLKREDVAAAFGTGQSKAKRAAQEGGI
jgi:integrase